MSNRVLLLHPDDQIPERDSHAHAWDLIVDLGRAPAATYEEWSRKANCKVVSVFDFAQGTDDLHRTRELLEHGMDRVVDRFGIDWWDVLVQSVLPELQQLICMGRLIAECSRGADIVCTRPHFLATALQRKLNAKLSTLETPARRLRRRASHYAETLARLDAAQLAQVIQDKFDPEHAVRSRTTRRLLPSNKPKVLLPSAYVNVSRIAVAFAATLPDTQFLLIHARNIGRLNAFPPNVHQASLDGYFSAVDRSEWRALGDALARLRRELPSSAQELGLAEAGGVFASLECRLRWVLAVRDAWIRLFDSQAIGACLCADDSNPYSRLPLIIAKLRGLPALACHHGALDSRMAIKKSHADFYIAKSKMERDYLVRVCRVSKDAIVTGGLDSHKETHRTESNPDWLVFFTEPYHAAGWRTQEIYRDLLPKLASLAQRCRLELAFKLHPFESISGHRKLLRQFLGHKAAAKIRVLAGPISAELWERCACALTVQSTVALECSSRGIPIFLCGWLADRSCGYGEQFERFGSGRVLRSPVEFEQVTDSIKSCSFAQIPDYEPLNPKTLRSLLNGTFFRHALATA